MRKRGILANNVTLNSAKNFLDTAAMEVVTSNTVAITEESHRQIGDRKLTPPVPLAHGQYADLQVIHSRFYKRMV